MEALFKAIFTVVITGSDTITTGFVALNHLANGACSRAAVVEQKGEDAAALSNLDGRYNMAVKLQDILNANKDIGEEQLDAAEQLRVDYREQRNARARPNVVLKYKRQSKPAPKAPAKKK